MVTRHERGGVTWVDLESPTHDELHGVMLEFGIDARVESEIVAPTPYPLVALFPEYAYLILHFPTADADSGTRNQEVDIIAGKHFLITVRYEMVGSIYTLHKAFEAETLIGTPAKTDTGHLLERVARHLYSSMREEIEGVAVKLEHIERDIFSGKERSMVRAISETGRVLLRFETTLARHEEPLSAFLEALQATPLLTSRFKTPALHIGAERAHVASLVASYRAVARELRATNDALLSSAQNEALKMFTAITVAFLPLTFVAGLFGMHTEYEPIIGMPHDFWVIVGLMVVLEVLLLAFLRAKRWL